MSPTVWLGTWDSVEDLAKDFGDYDKPDADVIDDLDGAHLLLAWYGQGSYDGSSEVYYEKDGKLYMNTAGHCSCHGLEDQWSPSEMSWEELAKQHLRSGENDYYSTYTDDEQRKDFALRSLIRERGFELPVLSWEETLRAAS
jgi:hypothetical protein